MKNRISQANRPIREDHEAKSQGVYYWKSQGKPGKDRDFQKSGEVREIGGFPWKIANKCEIYIYRKYRILV